MSGVQVAHASSNAVPWSPHLRARVLGTHPAWGGAGLYLGRGEVEAFTCITIEGVGFSLHTSAVCLMSLVLYLDHDEMKTLSFSLSLKAV